MNFRYKGVDYSVHFYAPIEKKPKFSPYVKKPVFLRQYSVWMYSYGVEMAKWIYDWSRKGKRADLITGIFFVYINNKKMDRYTFLIESSDIQVKGKFVYRAAVMTSLRYPDNFPIRNYNRLIENGKEVTSKIYKPMEREW